MSKYYLVILLFLPFNSLAQNLFKTTNYPNVIWKEYSESEFSIRYPSNWELNLSRQMGTRFIIVDSSKSKSTILRQL